MGRRRIQLVAALAGLALVVGVAPAQPAPREESSIRVVALEWDVIENLLALGITPVGGADLDGYKRYVSVPLPDGIEDVGTRQEPSIERIAKLRPDLIVAPGYRLGRNASTLEKIADVLVTDPFPGGSKPGRQYDAMVTDFLRLGAAVGEPARAKQVVAEMDARFAKLRTRLAAAHRKGARVTIATPGGTSGSPSARLFTANSAGAGILQRLGLRNAWSEGSPPYGFSTVGIEALRRVQSGWLAFIVPSPFAGQVATFTREASYKRLAMVKEKRVVSLRGDTWLFGGPTSAVVFATRLANGLTR